MRGVVEIWDGNELILEEPNMLVDGAGELIADVMTVSRSLSGIDDAATNAVLDASNYRMAAISFGTGSYYFNNGGRGYDERKNQLITGTYVPPFNTGLASISPLTRIPNDITFGYDYNPDFTTVLDGHSNGDDKASIPQLPTAPNPTLKTLETNTNTSAVISTLLGTRIVDLEVSSYFPGNGQHCNFLPSAIASAMMEDTPFGTAPSSLYTAASLLGAFQEGSSTQYAAQGSVFYNDGTPATLIQNGGIFNEASSMDVSGFVTTVMSSVPDAQYGMSSTSSGLCMSAPAEETNKGFPFVEYSLLIGSGDLQSVNHYGGIYHMGLWTIDMNKSLLGGNTPPFAFSVLNNPRKYRLFCRKGLSKNLCYITDNREHVDLTLKWRIYFR